MGEDPRHRAALARYRARLTGKRVEPPLIALLVALRELALAGGFTQVDAAGRVEPGDGPKLHESDPDTGRVVVSRRRVSEQFSPRDRMSPPCIPLTEAFVALHAERIGLGAADLAAVTRRINTLYEAARAHAQQEKRRQHQAAVDAGRRGVSASEVRDRERRIAALEAKLQRSVAELNRARRQVDELDAGRDEQAGNIAVLTAEVTRLREQLAVQAIELTRLREQEGQYRDDNRQLQTKLLRARAEADQLEARIAELSATATDPDSGRIVRQALRTDGAPHRSGRAKIGTHIIYQNPDRRALVRSTWIFSVLMGVAASTLPVIFIPVFEGKLIAAALIISVHLAIALMVLHVDYSLRVTDRGLRLDKNKSYLWHEIGRLTRVVHFVNTPDGRAVGAPPCPLCGRSGPRSVAAIEVYDTHDVLVTDLNLEYMTSPDCGYHRSTARDTDPKHSRRLDGVSSPSPSEFLQQDWNLFCAVVTTVAPHIQTTERHLDMANSGGRSM